MTSKKNELINIVNENGGNFSKIYSQKDISMEFVEEFIEFLDIPFLLYNNFLSEDFINNSKDYIESLVGSGNVDFYLKNRIYSKKYLPKNCFWNTYKEKPKEKPKEVPGNKVKFCFRVGSYTLKSHKIKKGIFFSFEVDDFKKKSFTPESVFKTYYVKELNYNEESFVRIINTSIIENECANNFAF